MKKEDFVEFKKEHLTGPVPIYNKDGSPIWDLYVLKLISNDGNDAREVRLCTEPNCIDVKTADPKLVKSFFADSLFGEKGLFKENAREDWIFLGKLNEEGKIEGNKFKRFFYKVPYSSESAQIYFDTKYYAVAEELDAFYASKATNVNNNNSISNTVPAKSNSTIDKQGVDDLFALAREEKKTTPTPATISSNINNEHSNGENKKNNAGSKLFNNKGKTYVMSDIHGMYGSYMDAMEMFKPDDHVIIAGDAIDRGSGGVDILLDIIEKKKDPLNNPKITFLLGNHEWGLIETLVMLSVYNITLPEIFGYIKYCSCQNNIRWNSPGVLSEDGNIEKVERFKAALPIYQSSYDSVVKKMENVEGQERERHFKKLNTRFSNQIGTTLNGFTNLTSEKINEIYNFLIDSYIAYPIEENNQKYLIVHAAPPPEQAVSVWNKILNMEPVSFKDCYENATVHQVVFEERDKVNEYTANAFSKGFVTICGHTPSDPPYKKDSPALPVVKDSFIRIDGACGHRRESSNLIVFNVTDNTYDYIPEKEYKNEIVTSKRK